MDPACSREWHPGDPAAEDFCSMRGVGRRCWSLNPETLILALNPKP